MALAKSGKPLCEARYDGRGCRRVGVYQFQDPSCGCTMPVRYCERCAESKCQEVYDLSLQEVMAKDAELV